MMTDITLTGITRVQRELIIWAYKRGGVFTWDDAKAAHFNIRTKGAIEYKRILWANYGTGKYYLNPDFCREIREKLTAWGVELRNYGDDFGVWFDAHLGYEPTATGGGDEPDYNEQDTPILPMPAIDPKTELNDAADQLTAARLRAEIEHRRGDLTAARRIELNRDLAWAQERYNAALKAFQLAEYKPIVDEMSSSGSTHGGGGGGDKRYVPNACPNCGNPNYDYSGDGYASNGDIEAYYVCRDCDYEWAENPYAPTQSGGGDCPDYDRRRFTSIGLHWGAISDIGVNFAPLWRRLREWYELSAYEALQGLIDEGYVAPVTCGMSDDATEYTLTTAGSAYLAFCDGE